MPMSKNKFAVEDVKTATFELESMPSSFVNNVSYVSKRS
jgi:hypothetical protein